MPKYSSTYMNGGNGMANIPVKNIKFCKLKILT